jgi:hypothetical protein
VPRLASPGDADHLCSVTVYGEYVIVQPGIGRKGAAGWLNGEPEILDAPSRRDIGEAVLRALRASYKQDATAPVVPPTDYEPDLRRRVRASSETAFVNGSRVVLVASLRGSVLKRSHYFFFPTRLVPREGHSVLIEQQSADTDGSPEGIVGNLEDALTAGEPTANLHLFVRDAPG